jgi:hypothetical protein
MAGKATDLTGQSFGYLHVTSRAGSTPNGKKSTWNCVCKCGKELVVPSDRLAPAVKKGITPSCGCYTSDLLKARNQTHGLCNEHPGTYRSWAHIKGDRDPAWDSFEEFFSQMGEKPAHAKLLKIDDSEPHGPDNSYYCVNNERRYPDLLFMFIDFREVGRTARETVTA